MTNHCAFVVVVVATDTKPKKNKDRDTDCATILVCVNFNSVSKTKKRRREEKTMASRSVLSYVQRRSGSKTLQQPFALTFASLGKHPNTSGNQQLTPISSLRSLSTATAAQLTLRVSRASVTSQRIASLHLSSRHMSTSCCVCVCMCGCVSSFLICIGFDKTVKRA